MHQGDTPHPAPRPDADPPRPRTVPPPPATADRTLLSALDRAARAAAHRAPHPCPCTATPPAPAPADPTVPHPADPTAPPPHPAVPAPPAQAASPARPVVLADRGDGTVVRHGAAVAKAHPADSDRAALAVRLAVAAHPALRAVLLPPLAPTARQTHGRPVTCWPYGTPVDAAAPEAVPWAEAAVLLALLHRARPEPAALPGPLPPMRGPAKAARAVARMRAAGPHPAAGPVLRAWAGLPEWVRAEAPCAPGARTALCHGDLHLGQLVRHPAGSGPWRLIDVDDLGYGEPAWDLARPAAWHGCGVLGPEEWSRFLGAYRAAGGPAVPAAGDPWPALDVPARALAVQTAATAVAKAVAAERALDEVESAVVDACARMTEVPQCRSGRPAQ
ncbi:phosphotransferase family protein [Streptomyces sp. NPDC058045]|uniref:phosphotransferase family protein n=1 Tax=Streptomyces sp. NPDC058045 TaxID=3346311 RepID=UPI0036EF5C4F